MSQESERRPLLAALLSFLQPGLGHLYLREWLRGVLWTGLWLGALAVVVTAAGMEPTDPESIAAAFGLLVDGVPVEVALSTIAVTTVATLDAYWLAARNNDRLRDDIGRCRHCGKELDPTLEFCHWCTAPREDERSA